MNEEQDLYSKYALITLVYVDVISSEVSLNGYTSDYAYTV